MITSEGISRPVRWDVPFGPDMTDADVARVLERPPFDAIDPEAFPRAVSLDGILKNDCRVRRYEPGDIVVRQGDYGNSAFFVLTGSVRVVLGDAGGGLPASILGRVESHRKSFTEALAQLWRPAGPPEVRSDTRGVADTQVGRRSSGGSDVRVFLQDVPGVLGAHQTARIEAGSFFGEIAALGRSPRTATIFAEEASELLEIRWQGLRDIRRRTPAIKKHIDELYRQNSLGSQLRATPLFAHLSPADLARVAEQTSFETYGEFDWYSSYKKLAEKRGAIEREPVIAEAGHYSNGLILIRSGFARLSEPYHDGERTVDYLGKGRAFGLEEITTNWRHASSRPLRRSLRAVGYVDVLTVPTSILEELVLPTVPADKLPVLDAADPDSPPLAQSLLEFLAENRYINGTATMMIDLECCVRCDDCVTACATTHDGNPRFVRHGPRQGRFMVANACMHCVDPVCMIGCPTGAIHRSESAGQVLINDATCIGCMTCAESCPYDNIRMVEIRDRRGTILLDTSTQQPIVKATKCDLCIEQPAGPACQQACPHDALRRVDMQNLGPVARWMARR